jgi:hypothetical protein
MKPPSSAAFEMPPFDRERPDVQVVPRTAFHRVPQAVGRWHWLRGIGKQAPRSVVAASVPVANCRRMRRRGRAVLLWVLFWYVAVAMVPTLLKHRWQRIGPANEDRKWPMLRQLATQDPDRPLMLMMGSSRTGWAFRAGALDGMADCDGRPMHVYNFGIPATGPIYQLLCLRDMLAEGIRPRFLLIEFLPPLLCEAQRGALTEEGMLGFESLSARRMLQWLPYVRRPGKRGRLWLESRIAPCYFFRRAIQLELQCLAAGKPLPTYDPIDEWGWRIASPLPLSAAEHQCRLEMAKGGYSPGLEQFRLGKIPAQAVREMLDLCRRERVPAALVVMPESPLFRSWYSDDAKARIRGFLEELGRAYRIPIIDANEWLAEADFEDGHHTQLWGAESFTSRLKAELPRLLSQSQAAKSD